MFKELSVNIGNKDYTAFFKEGFYQPKISTPHLHKHNYGEIHIVSGGNATYIINEKTYKMMDGSILAIPRDVYHCCIKRDETTNLPAFQLTHPIQKPKTISLNKEILKTFTDEIENCISDNDYTKISAYISLFCSELFTDNKLNANPITDYPFLIYEFFSTNYSGDVRLCHLAEILHLSERQTERLVIEYTGKTFKEELVSIRMEMAEKLKKSGMPLTDIARYVGYKSYAGFYKAFKKSLT